VRPTHRHRRTALACAALLIPVMAACSGKAAPPAAGGASGGASPSQAISELVVNTPPGTKEVDQITWNNWEGEPFTLSPYQSADYKENTIVSNLCETLVAAKPDFTTGRNLATAWTNPDPTTWVFDLRKDVTFWDGSPMTAEDVAFSMKVNRTDPSTFYNYLYARVASVTASGPNQVTVRLTSPDYLFPSEMADFAGVVVQKKAYEKNPKAFGTPDGGLMCTGPYRFTSWTKGSDVTVTRYDGYWDKTRAPKVKKIKFTFVTDEASLINGLLSGQIDGAYDFAASGLGQLKASSAGRVYLGPHTSNLTYVRATKDGLFSDLNVRKALNQAIDWNGLSTAVYGGTATRLRAPMPPSTFVYGQATLTKAFDALPDPGSGDVAAAKETLAKATVDVSKPFVIAVPSAASSQALGNAVVDGATKIGLKGTLKVVPADQYTSYLYDPKARAGVDLLFTDFWPNVPDPLDWLGITAVTGGSFNQSGYSRIDADYGKALATKDPEERATLVAAMMTKLTEDLSPMAPGVSHSSRLWMNNRISGAPASFSYVYYPWAASLGGTS
jgi:peptide/nickel transport system substrate-binding protein